MPTFYDPVADAGEASQALRGLAHASRAFDHPQDLYGVLGDLLSGVRSLRQVLDQLADAHLTHRARAHDDAGSHDAGVLNARVASAWLREASALADLTENHLDTAMAASGRIAWHDPGTDTQQRWISVVRLEGAQAQAALDRIDRDGVSAGLDHLTTWDRGEATTTEALENGYVYDEPPAGSMDHRVDADTYLLRYGSTPPQIALYRRQTLPLDPDDPGASGVDGIGGPDSAGPATGSQTGGRQLPDASWFGHPGVAAVAQERGLGR